MIKQVEGQLSWCDLDSQFGKMYLELSAVTEERIFEPCWKSLSASSNQTLLYLNLREENGRKQEQSLETAGAWHGEPSTLNIGESPSVVVESHLSWILEDNVPEKYYLTEAECVKVLERARNRGKVLPHRLKTALTQMIEWWKRNVSDVKMICADYSCAIGGISIYAGDHITSPTNAANPQPGDPCHTVGTDSKNWLVVPTYCLQGSMIGRKEKNGPNGSGVNTEVCFTLNTIDSHAVAHWNDTQYIVRRATPMEYERLQGYPDGWTDIGEWADSQGKLRKTSDGARYKALGNSIALPQWWWLTCKMAQHLPERATLASLFDGIGGFPLVWETRHGKGTALWASEIEEFPIAVTKKHFPEEDEK